MKKILVLILCALLICALAVVASAEDGSVSSEELNGTGTENLPSEDVNAPESENTGSEDVEADISEAVTLYTEKIVAYVKMHLEEISVIITLLLTTFYQVRKHIVLNRSIGTLNNNAITVTENSGAVIDTALKEIASVSSVIKGNNEETAKLLAEVRANEEEKKELKQALLDASAFMKTAKLANVELANEVAELLVLANIPNSKKEELYSRHLAAVGAIAEAEKTEVNTEVKEDVAQTA